MDRSKLIERLMATFLGELGDHVRAINDDLLALEKDPQGPDHAEHYQSLFRAAHSLKGAARSVGVGVVEEACHQLEEILSRIRDLGLPLAPELFGLLFQTADAIEEAGRRLREQRDLSDSPLAALLGRLKETADDIPGRNPRASAAGPPGPSAPAPLEDPASLSPPAPPPPLATAVMPPPVQTPSPERPNVTKPEEPPQSATVAAEPERPAGAASFVRIPAEKLDTMLARSGELHVARRRVESQGDELAVLRDSLSHWSDEWRGAAKLLRTSVNRDGEPSEAIPIPRRAIQTVLRAGEHLAELENHLEALVARMAGDRRQLERAAAALDEDVRRVRMLPFAEACQGLERVVRDVAQEAGKLVEFVVEGGDVELDRSVLGWLKDPLLHLVRNAVDHGIETPDRRLAAGKPRTGRVVVRAALRGDQVEVVVADDGGGLDREGLQQTARRRGIAEPADSRDLTDLIFLPGFSTSTIITNISGRGIGLDVVKSRLEALHGTIELSSEPGRGMRLTLVVPLTLTTLRALLVKAGGHVFALASANVNKLVRVEPADLRSVEGRPMLALGGPPLPVVPMSEALGLSAQEPATKGKLPALVVSSGERRMAFVVEELLTEQEIIVKNLGERIRRVRNISGATILPSGRIALVLNVAGLVRSGLGGRGAGLAIASPEAASVEARKRVIVVDDSVTTRTLEKSILEAAGYEVSTAIDGEAGWRLIQDQGADLVVSDIEMPRLDGFSLTQAIRSSARFAKLPVILISSRASERDKARGIEVGADAYIVKGAFDQNDLLETIAQLL